MKTDEKIKKDIVDQLFWDDRVDASDVQVEVSDGSVTLNGKVPSFTSLRSALEDAYTVREVDYVVNNLFVEYPEFEALPTDYAIQSTIEAILSGTHVIDTLDFKVSVENRIATLEGSVSSYWKKLRAAELALEVKGVLGINNRLTVVPSESIVDKAIAEDIGKVCGAFRIGQVREQRIVIHVVSLSCRINDSPVTCGIGALDQDPPRTHVCKHERTICVAVPRIRGHRCVPV